MMKAPLQRCLLRPLALQHRFFHSTKRSDVVKSFLLADIGEGIRECQIIQWFVQPGARVEQFDKLCEVQSDKAAVEITSPFDGVIKELHYEPDDMAIVGKPLMDIDIQGEISAEDEAKLADSASDNHNASLQETAYETQSCKAEQTGGVDESSNDGSGFEREIISGPLGRKDSSPAEEKQPPRPPPNSKHQTLATPAVRHLTKEHNVSIADIHGTGKDGRILKEDVHRYISESTQQVASSTQAQPEQPQQPQQPSSDLFSSPTPLTPVQAAMFRTMTASLSIPHFLYTTPLNMTPLTELRQRLNSTSSSSSASSSSSTSSTSSSSPSPRLTPLPFILKALSKAFTKHPLLNASLNTTSTTKPSLQYNPSHNIAIAVSTPSGLLVPVIRQVETKSISELAHEISYLANKAREGRLEAKEMQGASFTVSNIGSLGRGGVVAPVIVGPQVGILGVGRGRDVPVWVEDGEGGKGGGAGGRGRGAGRGGKGGYWGKREEVVMSWCADHRVVDGAECAQVAELVNRLLENVEGWVVDMR